MLRKIVLTAVALTVLLGSTKNLSAQGKDKVLILSPRVGPTIDAKEREKFHLFQQLKDFGSAIIFQTPQGSYYAKIVLIDSDGKTRDTTIQYGESLLLLLAEKIDHFEDLARGKYQIGQKPATLVIVGAKEGGLSEIRGQSGDLLPFGTEGDAIRLQSFPKIGFGIGLSSYSPNVSQLASIVRAIEQKYRDQGYSIERKGIVFTSSEFLWYSLKIRISRPIAFLLEAGSSTGDKDKPGNVTFKAVSGSVLYHVQPSGLPWLRPYVGVGVAQYCISIGSISYGPGNRISPVSSAGGYTYLSSLHFDGGTKESGLILMAGIELLPSGAPALNLFGNYAGIPDAEAVTAQSDRVSMKLSSFQFGARIMLYF